MSTPTPKIAVYSLPDLKNTTDDALPNYLNSLHFTQSHRYTDARLALGYTAVLIAGATFAADYQLGWDRTKAVTFWAVLAYFGLNSLLTYWIWGVERGRVYVGDYRGCKIEVQTSVKKHSPVYHVRVRYQSLDKKKNSREEAEWQTLTLEAPFSRWFDQDGHFVALPFQQWLAEEILVVGRADPSKARAKVDEAHSGPETPDKMMRSIIDETVEGRGSKSSGKGARSRKVGS
ncbi:MAG: hypothetical protein M1817_002450 [Caeruleum heppii]|nr:MAG: hypothetical protein M1817_002450 [Caeruleum heppii]